MATRQEIFTFSSSAIRDPIIYTLSQQFNIVTNILRADLAEDSGWIMLELRGSKDNIEQGIAWAISKGVRIDPADEEGT